MDNNTTDVLKVINEYIPNVTITLLSILSLISLIILVCEASGFLPRKLSKWLMRNKLATTIDVLEELGFKVVETKSMIQECVVEKMKGRVEEKIDKFALNFDVEIGKSTNGYVFPKYIDLMSATVNERCAQDFARELYTYYSQIYLDCDFVVTSKGGSPILGYEFSRLCKKPFVLHNLEEKFRIDSDIPKCKFDGLPKSVNLKKALIVDDSTTGGRKVLEIVDDLKKYGYEVDACLVVFAPQGKDAKGKLEKKGVKLHFIVEGPIAK
ncbi:phosphoribosyltransferase [Sulfurospirillum sp.]|uniref:phosphoribosyltransferase n=1 Tax=Sulfurospirillum sp. TaxID=2053622 RepID=UPI002FDEFC6B